MRISLVLCGIGPIFKGRVLGRKGHALNDFRRIGRCNNNLGCFCRRRIKAMAAAIAAAIAAVIDAVIDAVIEAANRRTTGHQPGAASQNPVHPVHRSPGVGARAPAL
jgi:hypothetical protein